MVLEAIWLEKGKEVCRVTPVMNILCDDFMSEISEIEINDGNDWYSCESFGKTADDFVIRLKKG